LESDPNMTRGLNWFFREFRKRGKLGNAADTAGRGGRVSRNRWKRKMNGRLKRDGDGKTRAA